MVEAGRSQSHKTRVARLQRVQCEAKKRCLIGLMIKRAKAAAHFANRGSCIFRT
jgi:hypothetical protein